MGQKLDTVRVDVEAKEVHGKAAICKISGDDPKVHGGVIFIPSNDSCTLEFVLKAGNTGLTFANKPFSSREDDCPDSGDEADGIKFGTKLPNSFTVDVEPVRQGRRIIHYALHFNKNGGGRADCDPIIIRD
jgi:hypothetical protein